MFFIKYHNANFSKMFDDHAYVYVHHNSVFSNTTDLEEVIECTDEIVIVIFDEEHDGIRFPDELVAFENRYELRFMAETINGDDGFMWYGEL